MTIQELLDWAKAHHVGLDTHIALRDKDDYLLVKGNISLDSNPYFGNCSNGDALLEKIAPRDANGDIDYGKLPPFIILSTGQ